MINHFKGRVQIPLRQIIRQRRLQARLTTISTGVESTRFSRASSHLCVIFARIVTPLCVVKTPGLSPSG